MSVDIQKFQNSNEQELKLYKNTRGRIYKFLQENKKAFSLAELLKELNINKNTCYVNLRIMSKNNHVVKRGNYYCFKQHLEAENAENDLQQM